MECLLAMCNKDCIDGQNYCDDHTDASIEQRVALLNDRRIKKLELYKDDFICADNGCEIVAKPNNSNAMYYELIMRGFIQAKISVKYVSLVYFEEE